MTIRLPGFALLACALALAGCEGRETGPLLVSGIGGPAKLVNPNLEPLDPASALLLDATAQGLVRFDAGGQIEPALAQSWIVSDDGLRYTFRLARTHWSGGGAVTAKQVTERLRAALSRASRNPLKPILGAVAEIEAMTDDVLEISLVAPRPNFLQMLAQPELAILLKGQGTGPYRARPLGDGGIFLSMHREDDQEEDEPHGADLILRGDPAPLAVARFGAGRADLVTGGTIGDLPIARAAEPPAEALRFDPVAGLYGLAFAAPEGLWASVEARQALSMALDREALVAALAVPNLQPRASVVPPGVEELGEPASPEWTGLEQAERRQAAAEVVARLGGAERPRLRVALPDGPAYRLVFAHLRRDWRAIGVDAERVAASAPADLRIVDEVAPVGLASWYLRHFTCAAAAICSAEADGMLEAARRAPNAAERRAGLAAADRAIAAAVPFIAIAAPVRWSLVSDRLGGFQANPFGRRFPGGLVAAGR
jgi:peptide/nickel transport system substrate-binding protein